MNKHRILALYTYMILIILLLTHISFLVSSDDNINYIISGNHVFYNNSYVDIDVFPHTDTNIINHTQYANFTWKKQDNKIDIAFCFSSILPYEKDFQIFKNYSHSIYIPTVLNITKYYILNGINNFIELSYIPEILNYGDIPSKKYYSGYAMINGSNKYILIGFDSITWLNQQHTNANFTYHYLKINGGVNETKYYFDWYSLKNNFQYTFYNGKHYYFYKNIDVKENKKYVTRWFYNLPVGYDGKWELLIKLSSDTIQEAFNTGRYAKLDPWYNANWLYYKTITVTNPILNYALKVSVYKNNLGGAINCSGHCNDNFSDLRFVYNNITEFSYWIQDYVSGSVATIWIRLESNVSAFEMYYGNIHAKPVSNGTETFEFFDDFSSNSINLSKWEQSGLSTPSTVSFSGGVLYIADMSSGIYGYNSIKNVNKPFIIEEKFKYSTTLIYTSWFNTFWVDSSNFICWVANGADTYSAITKEAGTYTLDSTKYAPSNNVWYNNTVKWKYGEVKYYIDSVLKETLSTNVLADSYSSIGMVLNTGAAGAHGKYIDWIFARVYTGGTETNFSSCGYEKEGYPLPPENINCLTLQNNTIYINFTKGARASNVIIRYSNILFHPTVSDTILCNITGNTYYFENPNINKNYFFILYSYNYTSNIYGTEYTYTHESTFGYGYLFHFEKIINATGTHEHNNPLIKGNYTIYANYTGNSSSSIGFTEEEVTVYTSSGMIFASIIGLMIFRRKKK